MPVVVRDAETEEADRAVENIARKQLNPYEEAKAVRAMLDRGLTEDGAAQALGWPKARVSARVKLLELPERAQQLIGDGDDRAVRGRSAARDRHGRARAARRRDRLPRRRQRVGGGAARARARLGARRRARHAGERQVFAAHLHTASAREIAELRLGKKTEQLYARVPSGFTGSSTATPTGRRRSASPRRTSTRPAPPAC